METLCGNGKFAAPTHWRNIVAIDLNFGCPKPDIVKYQLGPAMLSSPRKVESLFESLKTFKGSGAMPSLKGNPNPNPNPNPLTLALT